MNYFAHGMRFLNRPYFLAGTAIPDWLSVADRKVRMRSRRVMPFADGSGSTHSEIAAGILQHLHDDSWFHQTRAFAETSIELSHLFRDVLGPDDGFRPGFLGHIVTEILLDGVLIEKHGDLLDEYYSVLSTINETTVEQCVNQMSKSQTDRLALLIPRFQNEQFLRDYVQPSRLLFRLNQVMRRVKLNRLPDEIVEVLRKGWTIVADRVALLLPETHFSQ